MFPHIHLCVYTLMTSYNKYTWTRQAMTAGSIQAACCQQCGYRNCRGWPGVGQGQAGRQDPGTPGMHRPAAHCTCLHFILPFSALTYVILLAGDQNVCFCLLHIRQHRPVLNHSGSVRFCMWLQSALIYKFLPPGTKVFFVFLAMRWA